MSVTIVDIARKLNLSHTTVSRVLNKRSSPYITEKTRLRVMEVCAELGYQPNSSARALVTGRTHRVAFWVPRMEGRFFHELMCRFHRLLRTDRYEMITGEFDWHMSDASQSVGFTRMDVDGVLIFGGALGHPLQDVLEKSFPKKAPLVNMGFLCAGKLDYVKLDMYPAACQAVRHLIASGRKRIAHLYLEDPNIALQDRYRAYHDEMTAAGLVPTLIPYTNEAKPIVRQTVVDYVREHGCPDAIFCMSDDCALAALKGLHDLGKKVPDDVLLVGADGIEELEYLDTPISTILPDLDAMCSQAWKFLLRRMDSPKIAQQTAIIGATFVQRGQAH